MTFEGLTESGFRITTAGRAAEGETAEGPLPMELLLIAVGSCTSMDVAGILKKMRQAFTGIEVEVVGDRRTEHPKSFTSLEIRYTVRGRGLDPAQVERAVRLSQETYCSVAAMLRPGVRLTYTWQIEEESPELVRKTA